MSLNDASTSRNNAYKFNLVPKVNTKFRKIVTSIPPENSIPILNDLHKYEPESMSLELPVVWDSAENFQVFDKNENCWTELLKNRC